MSGRQCGGGGASSRSRLPPCQADAKRRIAQMRGAQGGGGGRTAQQDCGSKNSGRVLLCSNSFITSDCFCFFVPWESLPPPAGKAPGVQRYAIGPPGYWVFDSRKKLAKVYSPAMRKILALLVLSPLIVAAFVYHAKMMTLLIRFQPDQVQMRTAAR